MSSTDQMRPGPTLDAAVAEIIFGIEDVKIHGCRVWYDSGTFLGPLLVDKYSVDWGATKRVVDRLVEDFKLVSIELFPMDGDRWECDMHFPNWEQVCAVGLSVPHAICLAALVVFRKGQLFREAQGR